MDPIPTISPSQAEQQSIRRLNEMLDSYRREMGLDRLWDEIERWREGQDTTDD